MHEQLIPGAFRHPSDAFPLAPGWIARLIGNPETESADEHQALLNELAGDYKIPVVEHFPLPVKAEGAHTLSAVKVEEGYHFSDGSEGEVIAQLASLPEAMKVKARVLCQKLLGYLSAKAISKQPFLQDIYHPSQYVFSERARRISC